MFLTLVWHFILNEQHVHVLLLSNTKACMDVHLSLHKNMVYSKVAWACPF